MQVASFYQKWSYGCNGLKSRPGNEGLMKEPREFKARPLLLAKMRHPIKRNIPRPF